jgi:hypothetical protein
MLESILDIQYPERMEQKLKAASNAERGRVYPVATQKEINVVTTLDVAGAILSSAFSTGSRHTGFFSLSKAMSRQKKTPYRLSLPKRR